MPASQGPGSTIPRRRFGAELRRLREERGKLLIDVADDLLISSSKLSRLEKGHAAPQDRDVRDLLRYYGQSDTELGERMRRWASEGREPPWWQEAADVVPPGMAQYIEYETAADEIRGYVVLFVPSLLQTEAYARATIAVLDSDDPVEVDQLVELRLRRQEVLRREVNPVSIDIVIDESVFHRMVGSPAVMREQLVHLADSSELPNVSLRVYPFAAGPNRAIFEGAFSLFHFRQSIDTDVVNVESRVMDRYIEQPERVEDYRQLLDGLSASARDPAASTEFIRRMSQSY